MPRQTHTEAVMCFNLPRGSRRVFQRRPPPGQHLVRGRQVGSHRLRFGLGGRQHMHMASREHWTYVYKLRVWLVQAKSSGSRISSALSSRK